MSGSGKDIKVDNIGLTTPQPSVKAKTTIRRKITGDSIDDVQKALAHARAADQKRFAQSNRQLVTQQGIQQQAQKTAVADKAQLLQTTRMESTGEVSARLQTQTTTGSQVLGGKVTLPAAEIAQLKSEILKSFANKLGSSDAFLKSLADPESMAKTFAQLADAGCNIKHFSDVELMFLLIELRDLNRELNVEQSGIASTAQIGLSEIEVAKTKSKLDFETAIQRFDITIDRLELMAKSKEAGEKITTAIYDAKAAIDQARAESASKRVETAQDRLKELGGTSTSPPTSGEVRQYNDDQRKSYQKLATLQKELETLKHAQPPNQAQIEQKQKDIAAEEQKTSERRTKYSEKFGKAAVAHEDRTLLREYAKALREQLADRNIKMSASDRRELNQRVAAIEKDAKDDNELIQEYDRLQHRLPELIAARETAWAGFRESATRAYEADSYRDHRDYSPTSHAAIARMQTEADVEISAINAQTDRKIAAARASTQGLPKEYLKQQLDSINDDHNAKLHTIEEARDRNVHIVEQSEEAVRSGQMSHEQVTQRTVRIAQAYANLGKAKSTYAAAESIYENLPEGPEKDQAKIKRDLAFDELQHAHRNADDAVRNLGLDVERARLTAVKPALSKKEIDAGLEAWEQEFNARTLMEAQKRELQKDRADLERSNKQVEALVSRLSGHGLSAKEQADLEKLLERKRAEQHSVQVTVDVANESVNFAERRQKILDRELQLVTRIESRPTKDERDEIHRLTGQAMSALDREETSRKAFVRERDEDKYVTDTLEDTDRSLTRLHGQLDGTTAMAKDNPARPVIEAQVKGFAKLPPGEVRTALETRLNGVKPMEPSIERTALEARVSGKPLTGDALVKAQARLKGPPAISASERATLDAAIHGQPKLTDKELADARVKLSGTPPMAQGAARTALEVALNGKPHMTDAEAKDFVNVLMNGREPIPPGPEREALHAALAGPPPIPHGPTRVWLEAQLNGIKKLPSKTDTSSSKHHDTHHPHKAKSHHHDPIDTRSVLDAAINSRPPLEGKELLAVLEAQLSGANASVPGNNPDHTILTERRGALNARYAEFERRRTHPSLPQGVSAMSGNLAAVSDKLQGQAAEAAKESALANKTLERAYGRITMRLAHEKAAKKHEQVPSLAEKPQAISVPTNPPQTLQPTDANRVDRLQTIEDEALAGIPVLLALPNGPQREELEKKLANSTSDSERNAIEARLNGTSQITSADELDSNIETQFIILRDQIQPPLDPPLTHAELRTARARAAAHIPLPPTNDGRALAVDAFARRLLQPIPVPAATDHSPQAEQNRSLQRFVALEHAREVCAVTRPEIRFNNHVQNEGWSVSAARDYEHQVAIRDAAKNWLDSRDPPFKESDPVDDSDYGPRADKIREFHRASAAISRLEKPTWYDAPSRHHHAPETPAVATEVGDSRFVSVLGDVAEGFTPSDAPLSTPYNMPRLRGYDLIAGMYHTTRQIASSLIHSGEEFYQEAARLASRAHEELANAPRQEGSEERKLLELLRLLAEDAAKKGRA